MRFATVIGGPLTVTSVTVSAVSVAPGTVLAGTKLAPLFVNQLAGSVQLELLPAIKKRCLACSDAHENARTDPARSVRRNKEDGTILGGLVAGVSAGERR